MKYHFITMLNEFLRDVGREDLIDPALNSHSSVQLSLTDMPPINVDLDDDLITLWYEVAAYDPLVLERHSYPLLQILLEPRGTEFPTGQPTLAIIGEQLVLSAHLPEEAVSHLGCFKACLEAFFSYCYELHEVLADAS